jgi:hypothetical protein
VEVVLLYPNPPYPILQVLALEKLLLVTSTLPPAEAPPPRPALAALPPVNENPPPRPPSASAALARVPDSPAGAAGGALGNGRVAERGLGFGIAGAALAAAAPPVGQGPEVRRTNTQRFNKRALDTYTRTMDSLCQPISRWSSI